MITHTKNILDNDIIQKIIDGKLDIEKIQNDLEEVKKLKCEYESKYFELSRLIEYTKLLSDGFSKNDVERFIQEDNKTLSDIDEYIEKYNKLKDYMFGYPANLLQDSALTKYCRMKETQLSIMNNCADTYEQGNYQMDCKEYERKILNKLYVHFGLKPPVKNDKGFYEGAWGYVTSGGSESNRWGIENGLKKMQGGHVYFSESAHYSVEKAVKLGIFYNGKTIEIPYSKIPAEPVSEKIDSELLIDLIKTNWENYKVPAILVLTWGTTKTGAIDDVLKISNALKDIPHYIHLDAALYGGIAQNQCNAPQTPNMIELGIDSISVSLHKYIGNYDVKSAVIAKEKPLASRIDYIGQADSTTAGSRTINPFSALQKITEMLERKNPMDYFKNIEKFEHILNSYNIPFKREINSNIFIVNKPSDAISKKYQLSVFTDKGIEKAHIIIFPYHKESVMEELAKDLL